ncbi:hypothetical protein [Candidatus Endomicrobiellum agilis]|jgi:hypothetical protein|uniref:hypothetical protein n=1 Tax=Candidatus Endomicrobiellum agilis TaxID=3238957 RepID=UPI00358443A2|nr:hypothetical protein [Endomicrobium sp.]
MKKVILLFLAVILISGCDKLLNNAKSRTVNTVTETVTEKDKQTSPKPTPTPEPTITPFVNKWFSRFDKDGYDREGFDKYGYDRYGYRKDGYNKEGYNRKGEQMSIYVRIFRIIFQYFFSAY